MKSLIIEPIVTCPYCRRQYFDSDRIFHGTGGQVVIECSSCGRSFITFVFSTNSPGSYANLRSCFYNKNSHRWEPVDGKPVYRCKECGLYAKSPY